MPNLEALKKNLTARGFAYSYFETAAQAADYLNGKLDGLEIGFGGSVTVRDMGLYERLATHNTTHWHWKQGSLEKAGAAPVYICSVNAVAETGEIVNIDGNGNRVARLTYGPERVYLLAGVNKVTSDLESALWRAKNVAAPKNAQRLNCKTPCAVRGDKCYNCSSPANICRSLLVSWRRPTACQEMELILIGEELGF